MKIEETQKLWMSDVPIPDIFITDYLPLLSPEAVKVYLYAKHVALKHIKINSAELLTHLSMDEQRFKDALLDLAQHNVIALLSTGERFMLNDLKDLELQRQLLSDKTPELSDGLKNILNEAYKTDLMEQISDTFYHGMMGISQARIIDECLHDFAFEPEIVYALFSEAMAKSKLNQYKYIRGIAKAWHENGVKTYTDLQKVSKRRDEVKRLSKRVGKKLNRSMTEPDEALVKHWLYNLGYDFTIISLALENSVKSSNPNLNYFNRFLEDWHAAGLKTATEIKAYEQKRAEEQKQKRKTGVAALRGGFMQREFDESETTSLFQEFSEEELLSAAAQEDQTAAKKSGAHA